MNRKREIVKRCVAFALCVCCLGGTIATNAPVIAEAAISVSAATPVIRLDTASCELKTTAQKYYLAVTVTPVSYTHLSSSFVRFIASKVIPKC